MPNNTILIEELRLEKNCYLGRLSLNSPKTLNALTIDMISIMHEQLLQWLKDERIVAILVDSQSNKAFCAGGDVRAVRNNILNAKQQDFSTAEAFFVKEYALDYFMHRYNKPLVIWGSGITMGGGWGLFATGSHRVVTSNTQLAMPEVAIGFYPDVGGNHFLNRLSWPTARFLALTGMTVDSSSAINLKFATHCVDEDSKQPWLDSLTKYSWRGDREYTNATLNHSLAAVSTDGRQLAKQVDPLELYQQAINNSCEANNIEASVEAILDIDSHPDDKLQWMNSAQNKLQYGSPLSVKLIDKQLKQSRGQSLEQVFLSDMQLTANILRDTEMTEGVRALLVDKDRQPQWRFSSLNKIPDRTLESFFEPPWPNNPLQPAISTLEALTTID